MDDQIMWLAKLLLAHLATDFILQPGSWIESRKAKHFASVHLYLHCLLTAAVAGLMTGFSSWPVVAVIFVTHLLIDGWKSYQKETVSYFLVDQALHLTVIFACWLAVFFDLAAIKTMVLQANTKPHWVLVTAFVFVTQPAGILIGQLTRKWRAQIPDGDSLGNAGKWIGVIERVFILALVIHHQYASVGLLLTAKSLLRFNEPNRQEVKTEYLLIGTLISFGLAVLTGFVAARIAGL
ncbi:DUF3307 domain-containing protein [Flavisolibacter nicotianae]|uniref:DUF3307 domain-containing protein n=1 Tax=Flavisolibacter nicotianae TaxID=2364882 RepID=UPI000EAD176B|nr:DUF3307 domain-containing protein [Flavisolibacter nicotianae]